MKKFTMLLLALVITLPFFNANAQALSWSDAEDILYDVLDDLADEIGSELKESGMSSGVDFAYIDSKKVFDFVILANNAQFVKSMSDADLQELKDLLIYELVDVDNDAEEEEGLRQVIASMEKAGAQIRLGVSANSGGQPVSKAVFITAADLRKGMNEIKEEAKNSNWSPAGHTYSGKANGMTITYVFSATGRVDAWYNDGYNESKFEYTWDQDGPYIFLSDDGAPLEIREGGKTLTDTDQGVVFRLKK